MSPILQIHLKNMLVIIEAPKAPTVSLGVFIRSRSCFGVLAWNTRSIGSPHFEDLSDKSGVGLRPTALELQASFPGAFLAWRFHYRGRAL